MKLLRELIMLKEHAIGDTVVISGGEYKGSKGEIVDIISSTRVRVKLKEYGSRVEISMDNLGKKITEGLLDLDPKEHKIVKTITHKGVRVSIYHNPGFAGKSKY